MESESRFEMMWDCPYCGTCKLLGLTHRHCPSCGSPQDAEKRYFPPDAERIADRLMDCSGPDAGSGS